VLIARDTQLTSDIGAISRHGTALHEHLDESQ
jgi:hypothetical protein